MGSEIDPKLQAFLDLIAFSEGTSTHPLTVNNGYDVIVTGVSGPEVFTDFTDHPFMNGKPPVTVRRIPLLLSTAAGRYQIMRHWWQAYKEELRLPNFLPESQDAVAVRMITERGAIDLIESGNIGGAIAKCANIWASFPGNSYGQGGKQLSELMEKYGQLSGVTA